MLALGDTTKLVSDNASEIAALQAMLEPTQMIPTIKQLREWEDLASKLKDAMTAMKRELVTAMHG